MLEKGFFFLKIDRLHKDRKKVKIFEIFRKLKNAVKIFRIVHPEFFG